MQYRILADDNRLPARDDLVHQCRREICAGDGDKRILLEEDLRTGEMNFDDCFMFVVAHKQIGHLCSINIHCSAGTNAPVTEPVPAQILDRIEQAGLNNRESHNNSLMCRKGFPVVYKGTW